MSPFAFAAAAFSHWGTPSSKRIVMGVAAFVLCLVTACIGYACAKWIKTHGDLGTGAVAALSFSCGITATLAGVAYRKPDGSMPPTPLMETASAPRGAATVGASAPATPSSNVVLGSSTDGGGFKL